MKPLRLVIITRRFWPIAGLVEQAVADLAAELIRLGHHVDVLTSRWGKSWPRKFRIREIPVQRIDRPSNGPWGGIRFQKGISRFIEGRFETGKPLDGAIVFGMGQENDTTYRTFQKLNPDARVLTRIDNRIEPYHRWSQITNRKNLTNLNRNTAVIADSDFTREHLRRFVEEEKIHVIPDGVTPTEISRSSAESGRARQALSDAHPILGIEPEQPLVVSASVMDKDGGLVDLVTAWPTVLKSHPNAKLWLIGDGTHGQQIWNAVTSRNLVQSVVMPGNFDLLDFVWRAADLYVHSSRTESGCSGLTRAMSHGLCPVATASSFTAPWVRKNESGFIVPQGKPRAIAEAVIHGISNRELCTRLGQRASAIISDGFGLTNQALHYLSLLSLPANGLTEASTATRIYRSPHEGQAASEL